MNPEMLMVLIPGWSWIMFALGGTQISDKIKGKKWIRRYVLPISLLVVSLFYVPWWQAILATLPAIAIFSLGYGERTPWWEKAVIGCAYALIGVAIGISWWNLVTAIMFITLFFLSNTKLTANMFTWKVCEGFFGLFVGIQLAFVLMGGGVIW